MRIGRESNGARWTMSAVAVMLTFLLLGVHSSTALGAEVKRGDQVYVPSQLTIDDDLFIVARRAVIEGSVTGNVTAATAFLNTVGPIGGDLTVASGRVEVRGPVAGDVSSLAAMTAIYGEIAGDVVVAGGQIRLFEEASIAGDLVILGGQVEIIDDARVDGEVRGAGLSVMVEGHVRGDLDVTVRRLHLTPGAQLDGAVHYRSGREARVEPGAIVAGPLVRRDVAELVPLGTVLFWSSGAVLRFLIMIIAGGALLLVSPRGMVATAERCRAAPLEASLVGITLGFLVPVVLVLLAVTVIGLPLALMGGALLVGALYLSQAVVGLGLGRWIVRLSRHETRRGINFVVLALGVLAISSLRLIPISGLGLTVAGATATVGLGAIAMVMFGSRKPSIEREGKTSLGWRMLVVIAGCLLGLVVAGGVAVTMGAAALWLLASFAATSSSSQLTVVIDRNYLALIMVAALTITLGFGALAFTIYRRL